MWSVPRLWPHRTQYSSLVVGILLQTFPQGGEQTRSPGDNGPGITPWLMMKPSPSRLATCKHVLLFPRPQSSRANNTLLLSSLLVSDSFPHSPSVLPGFTCRINYLPQILVSGNVFWGIQHQVMQLAVFCQAADFDSEPRATCAGGSRCSLSLHI